MYQISLISCAITSSILLLSPVAGYAQTTGPCAQLFSEADANDDGLVSKEEYIARVGPAFDKFFDPADSNGDGFLDEDEFCCIFTPGCLA